MLDTFNIPTPQTANYQEFYGGGSTRSWLKPRGASMVRMLLIGAGGGGSGGTIGANGFNGGASGAITEWIGPAIFIPDELRISIGAGGAGGLGSSNTSASAGTAGTSTLIVYQQKDGTGYTLLTANGGGGGTNASTGGTAASASANNNFGASGIFSSIAGQAGANANSAITASTTTFLSGGASGGATTGASGFSVTTKYGYPSLFGGVGTTGGKGNDGYFLTQPILLSVGGAGGGGNSTTIGGVGGIGGIGSGGGGGGRGATTGGAGGRGGDGAVFIWAW